MKSFDPEDIYDNYLIKLESLKRQKALSKIFKVQINELIKTLESLSKII